MKFVTHTPKISRNGVNYASAQTEELNRYHITRFEDGKQAFSNQRPRKNSIFWGHDHLIWDTQHNAPASNP